MKLAKCVEMCYNISVKLIMFFSCGAGKSLTLANPNNLNMEEKKT